MANSSIGQAVATDAAIVGKGAMIAGGAVAGAGLAAGNFIANDNYLDGKWSEIRGLFKRLICAFLDVVADTASFLSNNGAAVAKGFSEVTNAVDS